MSATATEIRKTLFQQLDKAAKGETISFTYKGARMRIALEPGTAPTSKLSRLVYREGLADEDNLNGPYPDLMEALEAKWAAKYPIETDDETGG